MQTSLQKLQKQLLNLPTSDRWQLVQREFDGINKAQMVKQANLSALNQEKVS